MKVDIIKKSSGYFDEKGNMTIDGLVVTLSTSSFTYRGDTQELEAIELEIPKDPDLAMNTRLYICKDKTTGELYYYCQSSYIGGTGGISYDGEDELVEVLFDIDVQPDGTTLGFARMIHKETIEPIETIVTGKQIEYTPAESDVVYDGPASANSNQE